MTTQNGPALAQVAEEPGSSDNPAQLRQRRTSQFRSTSSPSPAAADRNSPGSPMGQQASNSFRTESFRTSSSSLDPRPFSLRSSTEGLLSPRATDERGDVQLEPSLWHSIPLLLAILPALAGLAFKTGSVFVTDVALLLLAAIYLNWFLVTPWTWYHSARSIYTVDTDSPDIAVDDALDEETEDNEAGESLNKDKDNATSGKSVPDPTVANPPTKAAARELRVQEIAALSMCFLGPLLGSYLLHVIRASLSQKGNQLISNLHLTLFVLGAEIRPVQYAMKLVHARTLHLQRIVHEDPRTTDKMDTDVARELSKRLDEIETSVANVATRPGSEAAMTTSDNSEQFKRAHSTLQTQIDALNRAVRRYEKRATAQTMQTEARLQDLETRLREALSLAAVAAAYAQKPSIMLVLLERLATLLVIPFKLMHAGFIYPLTLLNDFTNAAMVRFGLVAVQKQDGLGAKQQAYGKPSRDSTFVRRYKS